MGVNKVIYGTTVLVDLTSDSVTEETLHEGVVAHDKTGALLTGKFTLNSELNEQNALISQIKNALRGKASGDDGTNTPTQEKTVNIVENGTVEIEADLGYTLSKVTANVAVPIPDGYVRPAGTIEITQNGTYDVTERETVEVSVPEREIVLQDKTVTENGTYTADNGYDGLGSVTVNVASSGGGEDITKYVEIIQNNAVNFEDSNITEVGQYAFAYKTNLKTLSLPNLATSNTRVFSNCNSLTSLSIPKMSGYTYQYMAAYCAALTSADVKQASYVSSYSFYGCAALTKLEFNRVTTIATNAFNGCTKLATLILRSTSVVSLGGTSAFTGTKIAGSGGYIYVPASLVDSYKSATNWSTYSSKFRAIEDYPSITGG